MSTTLLCQFHVFPSVTPVCFALLPASWFAPCSCLRSLWPIPPLLSTAYFHDFYADYRFNPSVPRSHLCSLILPFLPLPKYTSRCISICRQHSSANYMSFNPLPLSALHPASWFALCCCLYSVCRFFSAHQNISMTSMPTLVLIRPFSLPALLPDTAFSSSA